MRNLNLHRDEVSHMIRALEMAASRCESMDRANVGSKRPRSRIGHGERAKRMRALREKLALTLTENPGERDFHLEPRP